MSAPAPTEYCLFNVQQWCLPSGEWASWVQALGSIAAIIAAFLIAWGQHQAERKRQASVAKVRAEIAGTPVLLKILMLVGAMSDMQRAVEGARAGGTFNVPNVTQMLASLPVPTDDEVLAIADHDAQCAHFLMRGRAFANQAAMAIHVIFNASGRWPTDTEWTELNGLFAVAHKQWSLAQQRLERLVPKGNG